MEPSWKYFCEQFGSLAIEPERGVDAFVALFEALEIADDVAAVELALANLDAGKTFHEAFRRFVAANLTKNLQSLPDGSFNYVDEEQAGNPAPYGPLTVIDGGEVGMASPVNLFDAILALESLCPGLTFESPEEIGVSAYGAMYFKAAPAVNARHEGSGERRSPRRGGLPPPARGFPPPSPPAGGSSTRVPEGARARRDEAHS